MKKVKLLESKIYEQIHLNTTFVWGPDLMNNKKLLNCMDIAKPHLFCASIQVDEKRFNYIFTDYNFKWNHTHNHMSHIWAASRHCSNYLHLVSGRIWIESNLNQFNLIGQKQFSNLVISLNLVLGPWDLNLALNTSQHLLRLSNGYGLFAGHSDTLKYKEWIK